MLKITYIKDPTKPEAEYFQVENVKSWLLNTFETKEELLDLRFFNVNMLGDEINTSDGLFLEIDDGEITVTHDSMIPKGPETWIYVGILILTSILTYVLTPKPEIPEVGEGRGQSSATNSLGAPSNEPRINQRIDDLFGFVAKHTPPLWQVPYRIGDNNREVEILLLCIGRGSYELNEDRIFDGNTPYKTIPNSGFSAYGPNAEIGVDAPELQIGDTIDELIGNYSKSNDLNPTELVPPNDLLVGDVVWSIEQNQTDPTTGIIRVVSAPDGWEIDNYYSNGDDITLNDVWGPSSDITTKTIYFRGGSETEGGTAIPITVKGNELNLSDGVSGKYIYPIVIVDTSQNFLIVNLASLPQAIKDAWAAIVTPFVLDLDIRYYIYGGDLSYGPREFMETAGGNQINPYSAAPNYRYYDSFYGTNPLEANIVRFDVAIGRSFDERVGPFSITKGVEKLILNFVSSNGFYKLVGTSETTISAQVKIFIEETDSLGQALGPNFEQVISYETNPENSRVGVFQTAYVDVSAYEYCRITCSRVTDRDKSSGVSNVDKIEWRDFYLFQSVDKTTFGDVTLAHARIPNNSTSQLVKDRRTNLDATRKITEYLGGGNFGPTESFATDKFDQILIHTALDPWIGRLSLSNINADGFLLLAQQIESYFGSDEMCRFGYDFDNSKVTYQDTFQLICNVVNCAAYVQMGVYDAFFEKLQPTSTMQITHRNKITGTETRKTTFDRKYDGIELTYRSEITAVNETIVLPEDGSSRNPNRIEISGCITKLQAWRRAKREYNKLIFRTDSIVFDTDEFGRMIVPNQRIDSPDSTRFTERTDADSGYRIYDGEIVEVNGLIVELSQPVIFTPGETHYISFTDSLGNTAQIECTEQDDEFSVLLTSLPVDPLYDGYSQDKTKFIFKSDQSSQSIAIIPETIEFNLNDGVETHTITSYNYTDKYYQNDLETP